MVIQEDSTWSDPELGHCKATDTFWRCGAGTGGVGIEAGWGTGARDSGRCSWALVAVLSATL